MTPQDVARWMAAELQERGFLDQSYVVVHCRRTPGWDGFIIRNSDGGDSIRPDVLAAFRRLTPDIVYERSDQQWRQRQPWDRPGRQQD